MSRKADNERQRHKRIPRNVIHTQTMTNISSKQQQCKNAVCKFHAFYMFIKCPVCGTIQKENEVIE